MDFTQRHTRFMALHATDDSPRLTKSKIGGAYMGCDVVFRALVTLSGSPVNDFPAA